MPFRVISVSRGAYALIGADGERSGVLAGKFHLGDIDMPVVGDWVLARETGDNALSVIQELVPRRNHLSRKAPGDKTAQQVMAANIDVLFIVQDAMRFSVPLVERYLVVAGDGGIRPVVTLNKCDLDGNAGESIGAISERLPGVDAIAVSALTGSGMDALDRYLVAGVTACLLGPSGAGKSSIVNRLLGTQRQAVREVREGDRKGRHATTSRELFILAGGGMVIDTPGMRELMPWDTSSLDASFPDIDALAGQCRFRDCGHGGEPGCAVRRAVETGALDRMRLENYLRLGRELSYLESRIDDTARLERKRKEKELHRHIREYNRHREKP